MKSFSTVTAFALMAAIATARPSSRLSARQSSTCILGTEPRPVTAQIAASINQWNTGEQSSQSHTGTRY